MSHLTAEEIIKDSIWNDGFDDCMKRKVKPARQKIEWVLNTLLSVGTDPKDEIIVTLKKALNNLK